MANRQDFPSLHTSSFKLSFLFLYCHVRPISLTGASQAKPWRHQLRLVEVIPFSPFPLSLHFEKSRHRHLLLPIGLSSCCRRSSHLPLSLRLPPPSPGARCSGTPSPTGVPTSRPPESRHLARPPLGCQTEEKKRPYSKFDYRIQGADVDPDGYAEAAGNLEAQGKTLLKF
uniref:Uncharacterized protein n=1 Tax=Oryza nivara TaxID=4536 RepID=A0A0E0JA63_ORYNI